MEAERIAKSLTIYQTKYREANAKRKEEDAAKAAAASTDAAATAASDAEGGGGAGDKKDAKKKSGGGKNGVAAPEKTAERKVSGEIIKKVRRGFSISVKTDGDG